MHMSVYKENTFIINMYMYMKVLFGGKKLDTIRPIMKQNQFNRIILMPSFEKGGILFCTCQLVSLLVSL